METLGNRQVSVGTKKSQKGHLPSIAGITGRGPQCCRLPGEEVMQARTFLSVVATTFVVALALPNQLGAQQSRYKLIEIGTLGGARSYINPPNDLGSPNQ